MGEIEIGDYVRTKSGNIAKCEYIDIDFEKIYGFDSVVQTSYEHKLSYFAIEDIAENIVKHSKNIIDLIEVGDYVNGSRVDSIEEGFITTEFCEHLSVTRLDYEIKSIVTKEQFSSMEYRLED